MAGEFDDLDKYGYSDGVTKHEQKVQQQLELIRIREEASQLRREELAGPPAEFITSDILDLLEDTGDDFDFVIPDVLARGERFVITGYEGSAGKTTFARQLCVTLASGIHPFLFTPMEPKRVAYVDLENGKHTEASAFKPLLKLSDGRIHPGVLTFSTMDTGIDLAATRAVEKLLAFVASAKPDFLFIGPIYKMCLSEDRRYDPHAQAIQHVLDRIRSEFGCAVMLEQHSPMTTDENKSRVKRPYGSQLWSGWPEFGKWLGSEDGGETYLLEGFRGDRLGGRQWPSKLRRGDPSKNEWPWIPVADQVSVGLSDSKAILLAFILAEEYKITVGSRHLAGFLGLSQSSVVRYLREPDIASAWASNQCKPVQPKIGF
jgi:replicative DNA helicase